LGLMRGHYAVARPSFKSLSLTPPVGPGISLARDAGQGMVP